MKENKKMNNTEFIMAKGTMTIEAFMDVPKDALASHLPDCILEVQEAQKNNGVILHGIRIMEPERIKQIVCEVNAACVDPEEVLSNNVYHYMKETGLVEMVGHF